MVPLATGHIPCWGGRELSGTFIESRLPAYLEALLVEVTSEGRRVVTGVVMSQQKEGTTRGQPSVGSSCLPHT